MRRPDSWKRRQRYVDHGHVERAHRQVEQTLRSVTAAARSVTTAPGTVETKGARAAPCHDGTPWSGGLEAGAQSSSALVRRLRELLKPAVPAAHAHPGALRARRRRARTPAPRAGARRRHRGSTESAGRRPRSDPTPIQVRVPAGRWRARTAHSLQEKSESGSGREPPAV